MDHYVNICVLYNNRTHVSLTNQYCHLICLLQPIQLNLPFVEYHIVCVYTYAPRLKYIIYYVSNLSALILMTSVDVNGPKNNHDVKINYVQRL